MAERWEMIKDYNNLDENIYNDQLDTAYYIGIIRTGCEMKKKDKRKKKKKKKKNRNRSEFDNEYAKIFSDYADSIESYLECVETYMIFEGMTEKQFAYYKKEIEKLIERLRDGDTSVIDFEVLNEMNANGYPLVHN